MGKPEELPPARLDHQKEPQAGILNLQQLNVAESSYATKLSSPKPQNKTSISYGCQDVKARITIHNGMPAVIFKAKDYYGVMAEECKLTVVGKFLRTRPKIEVLKPVGKPLSMDVATFGRTRPSTAKVRVDIDLTKPQETSVYVGQEEETNPLKGFTEKIEYEHVPKYCKHCKLIGHSLVQCRAAIKKKSVEEIEDKIEVEQTQASKQSEEEMEQTSNMISKRKVNQPDNNTQDELNKKKSKERVKRKQRRQRTAISKKIKKRKKQVNEHLQHQVEDMALFSTTEDRKSNDNFDKPIRNEVQ
ncbi:uncharacterized protein [Nicotiana sylvestris]|uniref:Uncharacterized protein LOC104211540 isoform X2 n=1 Tax=Nicotiana sylvestris TaxID=4096 RepID=A0A1U7US65_NICSY|nr:PREDICTED: uncharacterized protein LOC104211540 isoform X2 [Nicotiana sylvestris]